MEIHFYLDPQTGQPHIHNHGITEDEVHQIFKQLGEDRPAADGARIAIGQTESGRYLRVIYVPNPDNDSTFVVTAYELRSKQLKAYRRRRKAK